MVDFVILSTHSLLSLSGKNAGYHNTLENLYSTSIIKQVPVDLYEPILPRALNK